MLYEDYSIKERMEVERQLQLLREYKKKKKMKYEARLNNFVEIYTIDGYENNKNIQKFSNTIEGMNLDELKVIQTSFEDESRYWKAPFVAQQCELEFYKKIKEFLESMEKEINKQMNKQIVRALYNAEIAKAASKTLGGNLTGKVLTSAAKGAGIAGAVVSGGIEGISAGKEFFEGKIDGGEFTSRVIKETAGGGVSATAGGMAATAVATTAAPIWVPAAIGGEVAVAVSSAVKGVWDFIWE